MSHSCEGCAFVPSPLPKRSLGHAARPAPGSRGGFRIEVLPPSALGLVAVSCPSAKARGHSRSRDSPQQSRGSAWPSQQPPAGPWPMVAAGSSSSIPAWHRRWRRGRCDSEGRPPALPSPALPGMALPPGHLPAGHSWDNVPKAPGAPQEPKPSPARLGQAPHNPRQCQDPDGDSPSKFPNLLPQGKGEEDRAAAPGMAAMLQAWHARCHRVPNPGTEGLQGQLGSPCPWDSCPAHSCQHQPFITPPAPHGEAVALSAGRGDTGRAGDTPLGTPIVQTAAKPPKNPHHGGLSGTVTAVSVCPSLSLEGDRAAVPG